MVTGGQPANHRRSVVRQDHTGHRMRGSSVPERIRQDSFETQGKALLLSMAWMLLLPTGLGKSDLSACTAQTGRPG